MTVSLIIPTYNGARFIREAIESVWAQTLPPQEIVVVDDASLDETAEIVVALISNSKIPIRLIRMIQNSGGPAHPINIGIAGAIGKYITVLDQDDVLKPDTLRRRATVLSSNLSIVCAMDYCGRYDTKTKVVSDSIAGDIMEGAVNHGDWYELAGMSVLRKLLVLGNVFIGWPAFMFRMEFVSRGLTVNTNLRIASDLDFLCQLSVRGNLAIVPEIGYFRRDHGGNLSGNDLLSRKESFSVRTRCATVQGLIRDKSLRGVFHTDALDVGYHLRESGHYVEAFQFLVRSLLYRPTSIGSLVSLLKLLPHKFNRWMHACRPGLAQRPLR